MLLVRLFIGGGRRAQWPSPSPVESEKNAGIKAYQLGRDAMASSRSK